jgi:hypothetical protein
MARKTTNWEKIGIYIAAIVGFLSVINHLCDIKERVARLEVKVEKLENR